MTTDDRLHTFLRHVDETFAFIAIKLSPFQIWSSCVLKQPYSAIVNWGFLETADNTNSERQITSIAIKNCVEKKPQQRSEPCFHYLLGRDAMQPPCRA